MNNHIMRTISRICIFISITNACGRPALGAPGRIAINRIAINRVAINRVAINRLAIIGRTLEAPIPKKSGIVKKISPFSKRKNPL